VSCIILKKKTPQVVFAESSLLRFLVPLYEKFNLNLADLQWIPTLVGKEKVNVMLQN